MFNQIKKTYTHQRNTQKNHESRLHIFVVHREEHPDRGIGNTDMYLNISVEDYFFIYSNYQVTS